MVIPLGNRVPILRYAQERKSEPAELLAVQLFDGLHLFNCNINAIHSNDGVLIYIFGYLIQHIRPAWQRGRWVTLDEKCIQHPPHLPFGVAGGQVILSHTVQCLHRSLAKVMVVNHALCPLILIQDNAHQTPPISLFAGKSAPRHIQSLRWGQSSGRKFRRHSCIVSS